jgi:hypothetical protein
VNVRRSAAIRKYAWMRGLLLMLLVLFVSLTAATAEQQATDCGKPCREHPALGGPCFPLRGRMSLYNGAPSVPIWRVGTRRLLGVSEQRFAVAGYCNLPLAIRERLSWNSDLFGDFVVCPFTREEPGVMQLVCVDSASKVVVRSSR